MMCMNTEYTGLRIAVHFPIIFIIIMTCPLAAWVYGLLKITMLTIREIYIW